MAALSRVCLWKWCSISMNTPIIISEELCKSFGTTMALDRVSFSVAKNEIFGIIGPDGAGKSTLFEIMTSLLVPDSGEGYINGLSVTRDYAKIRSVIGYMPGRFSLYPDLSVQENLHFYARIFGSRIEDNYHLIEGIYKLLQPFAKRKAGALSGGMKQKLALCCALIHKPLALFLDEPTTGVDPVSRKEFWDNLLQLKQQGIPVLVSTPYMDEAIRCDRIALMYKGRIMQSGTPESIVSGFKGKVLAIGGSNKQQIKQALLKISDLESCFSFGDELHAVLKDDAKILPIELAKRIQLDFPQSKIRLVSPGIEDCFLQLMGRSDA